MCTAGAAGPSKEQVLDVAEEGEEGTTPKLRVGELGGADCALIGAGWRIPVHR